MMMFENMTDPLSAIEVNAENITKLLGEGVSLDGITIEITEEDIISGVVDKSLPENFYAVTFDNWHNVDMAIRKQISSLLYFKMGMH